MTANRELITRFEHKIQSTLARVWGEPEPISAEATPQLRVAEGGVESCETLSTETLRGDVKMGKFIDRIGFRMTKGISNNMNLLNVGIYSVPMAARLTGVSSWRIRRWIRGYRFETVTGTHAKPPVWIGDLPVIDGAYALSFRDLMEMRFVDAFLRQGVTWPEIRRVGEMGAEWFNTTHPFSTNRFRADGRELFAKVDSAKDSRLVHVVKNQTVFTDIIRPYLKGVEFADGGAPARWWPMPDGKHVVLDPERSFGKPIVDKEGVPTRVLAAAAASFGDVADVARWYRVSVNSAKAAVRFEQVGSRAASYG